MHLKTHWKAEWRFSKGKFCYQFSGNILITVKLIFLSLNLRRHLPIDGKFNNVGRFVMTKGKNPCHISERD